MASPDKKTKVEGSACLADDATIPINGVTRMLHFKVAGEQDAVQAEKELRNLHETLKTVDGFKQAQRFVCKEHWDVKYFARFANLDSLKGFLDSAKNKEKVEPIIKNLEKIAKDGQVHLQNFVADDWN